MNTLSRVIFCNKARETAGSTTSIFLLMGTQNSELYFVFMNYDPEYQRLRADRSVRVLFISNVY